MSNFLTIKNNQYFVDSLTISKETNNLHNGVLQLVEKYISACKFEMRTPLDSLGRPNKPQRIALLDEEQATFLITLFRNSDKVVTFKKALVKAYYEIRNQNRVAANLTADQIILIGQSMKKLEKENKELRWENKTLQPKADFYDTVTQSDEWLEMADVAKLLGGIGRNKIFELLRQKKVIIEHTTKPYQQFVDRGYFKLVETNYSNSITGEVRVGVKTVVSQRGLDFIRRLLQREEALEGD